MFVNILELIAIICIWLIMFVNMVLLIAGYVYYLKCEREGVKQKELKEYPFVSILIPAHNEGIVIVKTVESMLKFDYPNDKYEIIVINDNSSDNSADLLEEIRQQHAEINLKIINTDDTIGGKGKSNALNIGYEQSKGEYIVVYDADNTPERQALKYLVTEIHNNDKYGAVIGKFRCRNKDVNILTKFVNIETLAFQWMAQAGRWQLFKLCTIPGTNFIIRRSIIDKIGGWDPKAVAEDTEISFRIYQDGYRIKFLPQAVTWEQEPQTLSVWFRQRTRWVKGNIYVLTKNFKLLFVGKSNRIKFDILYFMSIYFFLLLSLVISDVLLILNLLGYVHVSLEGLTLLLWLMAFIMFVISLFVALTTEKGEMTFKNFCVAMLMYFTYCKMWMVVAIWGLIKYIEDKIFKKEAKWYKTQRYVN